MRDMSLKYIVRECNLSSSEKMFMADFNVINKNKIANQRLEAFAVYTMLKMYMGNDKESGFFLRADEKHLKTLASDVLYGIDIKFLKRVLVSCFDNDLFDKTFYDKFNILTSLDIQDKYFYSDNVKRRALKTIADYKDFVYASIWEDLKLADRNKKDACKNNKNASNNGETRPDETQTKTYTQTKTENETTGSALNFFLSQFPNKNFDKNTAVPENINLDLLAKKIKESTFLMSANNLDLTWCIKHYQDIISDRYKNFNTNQPKHAVLNYTPTDYSNTDLNKLFDNLEDIEI